MKAYYDFKLLKRELIDRRINNFTALSAACILQYAFLPLSMCQILKSGYYLTIYSYSYFFINQFMVFFIPFVTSYMGEYPNNFSALDISARE